MSDSVCMICGKDYMWCCCEGFQEHDHEIERLRARIEEQHGEIGLLLKRIEELESAEHLQNPTKSGGFGEREVSDE